jgi:hypothetical protein
VTTVNELKGFVKCSVKLLVQRSEIEDLISGPVLKAAIERGIARSLGMLPELVTLTSVGGQPINYQRKLVAGAEDVAFEVQSLSTDQAQLDKLAANVKASGQDGCVWVVKGRLGSYDY